MSTDLSPTGLRDFLLLAARKGWLAEATAGAMRSAANRVFGALDPEELVDVSKIDVDAALRRFATKSKGTVTPPSLQLYAKRIKAAIRYFNEYQKDPVNWKPPATRTPDDKGRSGNEERTRDRHRIGESHTSKVTGEVNGQVSQMPTGLTLPFPLRPDVVVTLSNVPRDLRRNECERISAFLNTLVQGD